MSKHTFAVLIGGACAAVSLASTPYATSVVSYAPGTGSVGSFNDPNAALGAPSRMTGSGDFYGQVTPFNGAYLTDQLVSISPGGQLTVGFDTPITNDPANPFGVDLLIFGNAFFIDADWPNGQVGGLFGESDFTVSVSADGSTFVPLGQRYDEGLFPTLGYLDAVSTADPTPGSQPSDFTKPVDPALTQADFDGKTLAEVLALYDGSGGGIPIDIAASGLAAVSYVRVEVPLDAPGTPDFDAFAVVPEPATGALLALLLPLLRRR